MHTGYEKQSFGGDNTCRAYLDLYLGRIRGTMGRHSMADDVLSLDAQHVMRRLQHILVKLRKCVVTVMTESVQHIAVYYYVLKPFFQF